jgi:RNA polymerase sigma-70 factor, ECF subfamily
LTLPDFSLFSPDKPHSVFILATSSGIKIKYEDMFRTYFTSLCYFARKYITDLDTCKEIVHTVFVNVWEKRDEFDFDKQAKSYLFTAVYNRCMNHLRDQKKFIDNESEDLTLIRDENSLPGDYIEAAELETQIWKIINALPDGCKKVFILNRFEGKKYAEIANELGISVKTVETQMSKALKTLRDHLIGYIHFLIFILIKSLW